MGSTAGRLHGLYVGPYVTAKFAVEAYMDCLRLEMLPFGVSVHILEPGAFKTELLSEGAQHARVNKVFGSELLSPMHRVFLGKQSHQSDPDMNNMLATVPTDDG
ncbi:hypothetical protein OSTOST_24699 [Ostertagia ostertagi]